jgi:hypothetical protein
VTVWWTPDCGYLHVETDPLSIGLVCPDGVHSDPGWGEDDGSTHDEVVP